MTKTIIFDFDGVICESIDIKTQTFRKLFEAYPEVIERIIHYHLEHGGLSRYEKFKVIYRDFLKKDLNDEQLQSLGQKFSQYSYEAIVKAPLVVGAYEFLKNNRTKYKFYVASGTPQGELRSIATHKGLQPFFLGIFGSPSTKETLIRQILKDNHLRPEETVFIGDSMTDYDGARAAEIDFIGRVPFGEKNPFLGQPLRGLIQDLSELEEFLKEEFEISKRPELSTRNDV